jgi:cystathionine beta-lyase family protein involved in aluminum resistance
MNEKGSGILSLTIDTLRINALKCCQAQFEHIDAVSLQNTEKVLQAFKDAQLSSYQFAGTSGYGYSDMGREKLDEVYARVFKAEKAIVRPHFVSGTHALATVLCALLQKDDLLISLIGAPYDTMQSVIGYANATPHSLKEKGVLYDEVPLKNNTYDLEGIKKAVQAKPKVVLLQRSRGYSTRLSLTIEDIEKILQAVKEISPQTICFVDNCYGEFAAEREPIEVGADIIAGSLIKNPGGGIAPTGGYIAGRTDLVEAAADYLTAPGLGTELGSYAAGYRLFFQGLFLAPHVTAQAIKGAVFAAAVFSELGFNVSPAADAPRCDLIQTIYLENEKNMCLFCQGIQSSSPVDAHVTPIPDAMPGYADKIIMAAGDFVQGSSIELSADGPIRAPYMIYLQGGIVFEHNVLAILNAARFICENREGSRE